MGGEIRNENGDGGTEYAVSFLPRVKIEALVDESLIERAVETIRKAAGTDRIGDGKIAVHGIEHAIGIGAGDSGIHVL